MASHLGCSPARPIGLCLALLLAPGCSQQPTDHADEEVPRPPEFEPVDPSAYTAKVKDLLVGQAPTDEELQQVRAHPAALRGLIDRWMAQPQFRDKMLDFFKQAFQQTQTTISDYDEQLGLPTAPWNAQDKIAFVRSAEESFARTAWQLIEEGRPFHEVLTTERFMLNPPLMSAMAYMDAVPMSDQGQIVNSQLWIPQAFPNFRFIRQTKEGPIPLEQTLNPAHPNFMKWYDPRPYMGPNATCQQDPFEVRQPVRALSALASFLYGGRQGCGSTVSQWTEQDWQAWRMVTVRRPRSGEQRTLFYDLPKLRTATELVVSTPRVGFFSTPAFFANWPTNPSNLARVTINQTMIVALGRSFDDSNITVQVTESTKPDDQHVDPGSTCYGCHRTMDPMRDFFRQTYTISYHLQYAPAERQKVGVFELDGVKVSGQGVHDLARAMAAHPRFATAWTQKLCRYANSSSCVEDDPEFLRVAAVFAQSGFSFKALVRELFSSPLVTLAAETKTAQEMGVTVGISRREHLCAALSYRLGVDDACALRGTLPRLETPQRRTARNLALAIPGAAYSRGAEAPLLPRDPNLFFVSATENLCGQLASQVVDAGATSRYTSAKAAEAISDFVRTLMALPDSDPRAALMKDILTEHHRASLAAKESPTDALRSTFVLACASPLAVSSGL